MRRAARRTLALALSLTFTTPLAALGSATAPATDEDARIVHALNRLAFGPRPGDVARVRELGLERWIERQLDPGSIDDSGLAARLRG